MGELCEKSRGLSMVVEGGVGPNNEFIWRVKVLRLERGKLTGELVKKL